MTAARINQLGPPQIIALERVDVPEPQELQVLVRVCAAGVGPWDALVRTGKSGLPLTPPLTLGAEISGIVEKVGANTTGFAPGDEVFGATNPLFIMGYAEYAVVAARMIAKKSAALSHIEAAAMPVVGVMAWQMLFDHAALREGQTVVIHGGAGNVGAYAVQLARAKKLHVIATVRNGDADYVRGLGAHEVINTETDNVANFARRADAVIDTVGGPRRINCSPSSNPAASSSLRCRGRMCSWRKNGACAPTISSSTSIPRNWRGSPTCTTRTSWSFPSAACCRSARRAPPTKCSPARARINAARSFSKSPINGDDQKNVAG